MHNYTMLIDQVIAALTARGYLEADATLMFGGSDNYYQIRLAYNYRAFDGAEVTYKSVRESNLHPWADPNMAESYVDAALDEIAGLPTSRELQIKGFVNQLEALKDRAVDLGVDADFVNPLAALMEKLASNALPAPAKR